MATLRITSDGDPYPAKAGNPLVNDGSTRSFDDGLSIQDQSHDFSFKYRGGSNTSDPENVSLTRPIGITTTGVLIYTSASSVDVLPVSSIAAPSNFTWNTIHLQSEFRHDNCGGRPETAGGEYRYRSGAFYKNGLLNNNAFTASTGASGYFSLSNSFGSDSLRHSAKQIDGVNYTGGHSKIIGFAFDGYPIYGPFGYADPADSTSSVKQMRSSYRTRTSEVGGRAFSYSEKSAGSFIEDYEYIGGLGDLDEHNGRFCVTPDYATGTYAYFLTFSDVNFDNPEYPYIIGPSTREQRPI